MVTADAAVAEEQRRGELLAWVGPGVQRGAVVKGPGPRCPDGGGGAVGDVGS